jgi:hypothetical protein
MDLGALAANLGFPVALVVYLLYARRQDDEARSVELRELRQELASSRQSIQDLSERYLQSYMDMVGRLELVLKQIRHHLNETGSTRYERRREESAFGPTPTPIRPATDVPEKRSPALETTAKMLPRTPRPPTRDPRNG